MVPLAALCCARTGKLVPDSVVIGMVNNRLAQEGESFKLMNQRAEGILCSADVKQSGWLLDGFPRTQEQAKALAKAGAPAHANV